MTDIRAFKALSLLTTIGVLVVTACTIQLRGSDESPALPKTERTTDAANPDLARCRSVTAEETAGYRHCQQIWAENRRRFLGRKNVPADPGQDDSTAGLASTRKDQSRMPQGYPGPAMPEASKP
ncbi:putative entry exclusion protein TrbK-alt [Bradyrhizobium sp. BRP20]|uniref:putative entry exclusion protein TrbK-alt n=1 Tax=unclassified Bradyrhizobium TaxID=2631580 RepID=UPI001CD3AFF1|nr:MULTISPECIES: putative entry exclusion protein TrbK-alt [unclassified Bradyrhizobium]MCA1438328.1 putative entry exclusion protein TrbK-alt [Bradyrhizobium sp. BRP20]MCA1470762.1 putative entry exclusion protein TrbK-alt [Bradyrhizobium sp. IC3195]MCA1552181.1 putative entry exclusion protein TrbK-alt [Bradyrhizobium sp. BRP19]